MASILAVLGFLALIWAMLSYYERAVEKAAQHRDDGQVVPPA